MSKFRSNGKREMPELNTSSLPDLIFTVLFFFMMVTSMRDVEVKVQVKTPVGLIVLGMYHFDFHKL